MFKKLRALTRFILATVGVLCVGNCISQNLWSGKYEAGSRTIELESSGRFEYVGGDCTLGYSDAIHRDIYSGSYTVEGAWITLDKLDGSDHQGCSIDRRLYALRLNDHPVLVEESFLQDLVNVHRSGGAAAEIYPWHLQGQPESYSIDPSVFLPPPYATLYKLPAPSGKVLSLHRLSEEKILGAGGRDLGTKVIFRIAVDIGSRQGAFTGMWLCRPNHPGERFRVETLDADHSNLHWSWTVGTTQSMPDIGMSVTGYCPVFY